ncbi:MAG: hypothetical protein V3S51_02050 [Dehalococcoidia bacterium]
MSDARVLAELMGWTIQKPDTPCCHDKSCKNNSKYRWIRPNGHPATREFMLPESADFWLPAYDTDLNAMREVWKVLKERGLWDEFLYRWDCQTDGDEPEWTESKTYHFLNDLSGQVKAAIKVLEAQG